MTIAFRADSSVTIGAGHISRCLALAEELQKQNQQIIFICCDLPGNLSNLILKKGYMTEILPASDIFRPAKEVIELLAGKNIYPNRFILDHYQLGYEWEKELKEKSIPLMVIEDRPNRSHVCDTLLVQNASEPEAATYREFVPSGCRLLLGPQYALLRPEFYTARKQLKRESRLPERLFVFFGGTDPTNETLKVIKALSGSETFDFQIDVVTGSGNPCCDRIIQNLKGLPGSQLHIQTDKMAELMTQADLAIAAGGVNTFERFCLGLPTIAIGISEDQLDILKRLGEEGYLYYLGASADVTVEGISEQIQISCGNWESVRESGLKGMKLVDGKGAARVAQILIKNS